MASQESIDRAGGSSRVPVRLRRKRRVLLWMIVLVLVTTAWSAASSLQYLCESGTQETAGSGEYAADYSCAGTRVDPAVLTHDYGNRTQPFALVAGAHITEEGSRVLRVVAGQPVCVRVVVPPTQAADGFEREAALVTEKHQPLAGHPGLWDSMMVDAVGAATGISVSVAVAPVAHAHMAERRAVHVYEGDVRLFDADSFEIGGVVEFRDAQWNYEPPTAVPTQYEPEEIQVAAGTLIHVSVPLSSRYHPRSYHALPACTRADEPGRWMAASAAKARGVFGLPEYGGRVWLPYMCRLHGYTYNEFLRCLDGGRPLSNSSSSNNNNNNGGGGANAYTIHWFGDTSTRRALKKITSLGEWCASKNAQQQQRCACDDSGEVFARFTGQNSVRDALIELNDEDGGWSVRENGKPRRRALFAPLARIYYHRWEGLTVYNGAADWRRALAPDALRGYPQADLVIVALGTLDAALTPFLEYTQQLDDLVALLKASYAGRHIIVRAPQHACCRLPAGKPLRRVQKDRNRLYGEYAARLFALHFGSLVHFWDVARIAEALPASVRRESAMCAVSNVPAALVEVENHVLVNSLCNLDPFYANAARTGTNMLELA
ncbi:hypothetical protein IW140_000578 [Coemansia sp. RSA 1813]|nr:hypothetical protein EV178_002691 [Coemansia sp. RSA 1646]KAJ1774047.1 hypothetical protein LPJ74_000146 [Coemansia sp. RSA 1843]KAJ2092563.1 hypothetical protein IW138_001001 [Coemansia sp. RSA 986]KAJ2216743.1 hypothetical protein EV179_001033 [Coemansia sp. RSA 487]KAJ2572815.1 hypothetical protein IW140_000578 [Coemansia sp. RSA 1813]